MKIALCLSGQPRGIPNSLQYALNSLIIPSSITDIFIHTWYDESLVNKPFDSAQPGNNNKLGVWNKSLQKGLTTYVADTYDDERQFMENMLQYERTLGTKANVTDDNFGDLMEEVDRENELNREANDMSNYIDDYNDGNFEGDEVENNDEFDS